MKLMQRKEIVILTNLLAFTLGMIFLLLSKYYFKIAIWVTVFGLLGAYLTISVIVNLFHRAFLKPYEEDTRRKELQSLLDVRINDILGNSSKYGFAGFIPEMDFKGLFNDLNKDDELWWLDTYAPAHELWEDNLRGAIARGAHIRMLVLSPNSPNAVHRAKEIGGTYTPERFKNELKSFKEAMEIVENETEKTSGTLEIIEYGDLPSLPLYVVTRNREPLHAYSSLFLTKPTAVAFPHMKWCVGERSILKLLLQYVQDKWERNCSESKS
jgi:hypothetical protein